MAVAWPQPTFHGGLILVKGWPISRSKPYLYRSPLRFKGRLVPRLLKPGFSSGANAMKCSA